MKVISIVNQKGGVGKTVTSVNVAIGLANQGKKVLAIDLDPQGSLSISLGIDIPDEETETIATIMKMIINEEIFDEDFAIKKHKENIDFIPANLQLSGLEMELISVTMGRESVLVNYIEAIRNKYDYVIIDCSPSLGMLTINALACCDEVIIPAQAHYLSIKGMEQLFDTINKMKRKKINEKIIVKGILITMVERSTCSKAIIELLETSYSDSINIFDTKIPKSIKATEISIDGISIYKHDPKGKLASAYRSLIEEVI